MTEYDRKAMMLPLSDPEQYQLVLNAIAAMRWFAEYLPPAWKDITR